MIFLDLVGGGGRAKSSFVITGPDPGADLFRDSSAGEAGDTGRYDESEPFADGVPELALSGSWKDVGGKLNKGTLLPVTFYNKK